MTFAVIVGLHRLLSWPATTSRAAALLNVWAGKINLICEHLYQVDHPTRLGSKIDRLKGAELTTQATFSHLHLPAIPIMLLLYYMR